MMEAEYHDPHGRIRSDLASLKIERGAGAPLRRRGRRRWPWVLGALLAVAGLAALSLRGRPRAVDVATAERAGGGTELLSGSGYVVTGDRYISIGVRVAGRIERYLVEEGQHVKSGDPLVQLDDRDYQASARRTEAALRVAQANLGLAEAELRRGLNLETSRVISQQELDVLRNQAAVGRATVAQLEAELEQARVSLDYTTLRAPRDGVVLAKLKEVGEIAVPGGFAGSGDLVRMANLEDMRAEVDVNEADLGRVRMGGPARVTPDAHPDRSYAAAVVKLYPQVDRQKGTLKVEVRILEPDDRLLPDMSARVTFLAERPPPGEETPYVTIPEQAVRRENDEAFVWLVAEGKALKRPVRIGRGAAAGRVRIESGLRGGEIVVVDDATLEDGVPVTPRGIG
jgi:RND family efflux transporter MFP subunit